MKRVTLIAAIALLPIFPLYAQVSGQRSLFQIKAGVSLPLLCFASSDLSKGTSGFASPGFMIDLGYTWRTGTYTGIGGRLFYGTNPAGKAGIQSTGSPYQWGGIMVGPVLLRDLSVRWQGDIAVTAGWSWVRTPLIRYGDAILLQRQTGNSFVWGGTIGVRYQLSDRSSIHLQADHVNLKPRLLHATVGKTEQHLVLMNLDAGLGILF
jgi:hypothetical protein